MAPDPVTMLGNERYISLTTFRRSGVAVATPVWVVEDAGHLFVWTAANSGKAKRIRNNPRVTVAPSTARGKTTGEARAAIVTILPDSEGPRITALLDRKNGLNKRIITILNAIVRMVRRRPKPSSMYLRIDLESPPTA